MKHEPEKPNDTNYGQAELYTMTDQEESDAGDLDQDDVVDTFAKREPNAQNLEDDPFEIERAIREDLEWARAGETVVRIPGAPDSNPRFP